MLHSVGEVDWVDGGGIGMGSPGMRARAPCCVL